MPRERESPSPPSARTHQGHPRWRCQGELIPIGESPHDGFGGHTLNCSLFVAMHDTTRERMAIRFCRPPQACMEKLGGHLAQYGL